MFFFITIQLFFYFWNYKSQSSSKTNISPPIPSPKFPFFLAFEGSYEIINTFYCNFQVEFSTSFSALCSEHVCVCKLSGISHVWLFPTLWTVAHQAPLSKGFSRQEYGGGLPCPPPGDLPDPGIEPASLMSPALAGRFFTTIATWEAPPKMSMS